MKRDSALVSLGVLMTLVFAVGTRIQAGEIIYADDIRNNVITIKSLARTADNIAVLVDTSISMGAPNKTLNKSYYDLEVEALTRGVSRLPDLGYNIGVYRFTPWEVLYPMQPFNEAKVHGCSKKTSEDTRGNDSFAAESRSTGFCTEGSEGQNLCLPR